MLLFGVHRKTDERPNEKSSLYPKICRSR